MTQKAMTPEDVSDVYGVPRGTLANMRARKEGPKFYKRGRRVIYFVEDVERWLKAEPTETVHSVQD